MGEKNGFLVLSRKVNEAILIGDDIEIVVSKIENGKVLLAVKAPRYVGVHRRELRERMAQQPR